MRTFQVILKNRNALTLTVGEETRPLANREEVYYYGISQGGIMGVVHAGLSLDFDKAALEVMQSEPEHLERLWSNTRRYRALLEDLKLDLWGSETPAIPVVLGSRERAYLFWKHLMDKDVFTVMSIAPGVPPGKDLVRTAVSAAHTEEDFEKIEVAFRHAVKNI